MPKVYVWTAEMISQLGTMPDRKIAEAMGCDRTTVWLKRRELKIPRCVRVPRDHPQLGKMPDRELAQLIGVTERTVAKMRARRGIPAHKLWPAEWIALLGTAPDREIGRRIGRTGRAVSRMRVRMGICAYEGPEFWTPERVALLGTDYDREIARRLDVLAHRVTDERNKRGIKRFHAVRLSPGQIARLGTASDQKLAAEWGCNVATVTSQRHRLGIPAFQQQRRWTAEEMALLGTMPDSQVAKLVGRDQQAVQTARYAAGIKLSGSPPHPHLEDIKREYTTTNRPSVDIAAQYGVPAHFLYKRARERGWKRPDSSAS